HRPNVTRSTHPIQRDEMRKALRRLQRESPTSPFVVDSERSFTVHAAGLARMIECAAAGAGLEIKAHPHCAMAAAPRSPTRTPIPWRSRADGAIGRSAT